jgi:hypothetical protein
VDLEPGGGSAGVTFYFEPSHFFRHLLLAPSNLRSGWPMAATTTPGSSHHAVESTGSTKALNKPASRKGKRKENISGTEMVDLMQTSTRSRGNETTDTSLEWSTLAESSASKVTPIFTKDGR